MPESDGRFYGNMPRQGLPAPSGKLCSLPEAASPFAMGELSSFANPLDVCCPCGRCIVVPQQLVPLSNLHRCIRCSSLELPVMSLVGSPPPSWPLTPSRQAWSPAIIVDVFRAHLVRLEEYVHGCQGYATAQRHLTHWQNIQPDPTPWKEHPMATNLFPVLQEKSNRTWFL
ncbi:hypothetical protein J1614_010072 [Plenodomus biglobosus]|nr:hypothetical protein J1614_010072 [Plenodomus biglobosus]